MKQTNLAQIYPQAKHSQTTLGTEIGGLALIGKGKQLITFDNHYSSDDEEMHPNAL